jgi:hypothetical protein
MPDITTAIDEKGANDAFNWAIAAIPQQSSNGSKSLGPFGVSYAATATFQGGAIDLVPPDIIGVMRMRMNWKLQLVLSIDLNKVLPQICFPQFCIKIWKWKICTPAWCLSWPSVSVPLSFADFLQFSANFRPQVQLIGGMWQVKAKLISLPNLQFGVPSALILAAIGAAVVPILAVIPIVGGLASVAAAAILSVIGVAGVTGLLGFILTPFVSGMEFMVYQRPQRIELLPYQNANEQAVDITIQSVRTYIAFNQEDELFVDIEIAP